NRHTLGAQFRVVRFTACRVLSCRCPYESLEQLPDERRLRDLLASGDALQESLGLRTNTTSHQSIDCHGAHRGPTAAAWLSCISYEFAPILTLRVGLFLTLK